MRLPATTASKPTKPRARRSAAPMWLWWLCVLPVLLTGTSAGGQDGPLPLLPGTESVEGRDSGGAVEGVGGWQRLAPAAHGQEGGGGDGDGAGNRIDIMPDKPCFLNTDTPHLIMENCAPEGDWLGWALGPWEYVTGGNLSMAIAAILILASWAKYRNAIYPMFVGVVMFPMSYFLFPESFLTFGLLMMGLGVGVFLWWAVTRQTE